MSASRDNWKSSLGFVLAASGSAIGLGNLWKFPYITWENGGGSFVLVYLVCILLVGVPLMIAEITIGRSSQLSTVPAFEHHAKGKPLAPFWNKVGWIGILSGGVILAYYSVIAGWSISSLAKCINWSINGYQRPPEGDFASFAANGPLQIGLAFLFTLATVLIVARGISSGIERATRLLMPALFGIMVLLTINALTLDGIGETFGFLFKISPINGHMVLEAMGHAFFTLSLGMGGMITYGSYMSKKDSVLKAVAAITVLDTVIALMSCVIMYSILFTFPDVKEAIASPVAMLFITIPELFYSEMPGGVILAPIFFVLVGFAALSSTISMLEVVVALLVDKMRLSRLVATVSAASGIFVLTIACALSNGSSTFFSNFNPFGGAQEGFAGTLNHIFLKNKVGVQQVLDHFASNWLLPLGGLLITIFAGWWIEKKLMADQLQMKIDSPGFLFLRFFLRIVAPLLILLVIYNVNAGGH